MIPAGTNVLDALADRRDNHHARCGSWLQRTPDVLMVPATVLAGSCYLIDKTPGPAAEAAFPAAGTGPGCTFQLAELADSDLRRMPGLVYAGLRLGGTDAPVAAIRQRPGIATVATVNLRDFATVRPRHVPALITVPGPG